MPRSSGLGAQLTRQVGRLRGEATGKSRAGDRAEQAQALERFGQGWPNWSASSARCGHSSSRAFAKHLNRLTQADARVNSCASAVETRLGAIQTENAAKLERCARPSTKLHATLRAASANPSSSFQRLEQVHRGLGEIQTLAAGVSDQEGADE